MTTNSPELVQSLPELDAWLGSENMRGAWAMGRADGVSTAVDGQNINWQQGDCFVVPNWTTHAHRNSDSRHPAILFSINDLPILELAGLSREEMEG